MNMEARKIAIAQEFLRFDNEVLISEVESFLRKIQLEAFEKSLIPMSIEQLNHEIDQSLTDVENGRLIQATNLRRSIEKWS